MLDVIDRLKTALADRYAIDYTEATYMIAKGTVETIKAKLDDL